MLVWLPTWISYHYARASLSQQGLQSLQTAQSILTSTSSSATIIACPLRPYTDPCDGHVNHWRLVDLWNYHKLHHVLSGGAGILIVCGANTGSMALTCGGMKGFTYRFSGEELWYSVSCRPVNTKWLQSIRITATST